MNSNPLLSVIVPVYKVARFLPNLLARLSNQTLKSIEFILVCDGDDEDFEICRKYVDSDSRFILISHIKKGLGGARNAGIEQARGRYIFFCDADDSIDLDFCEKMLAPFITNPKIGFTACGTKIVFEGLEDIQRKKSDEVYFAMPNTGVYSVSQAIFGKINVAVWNKIYRKDIIERFKLRFPEKMYNEDAYFNWCYWSVCESFYSLPDVEYSYIRRNDSLMAQTFNKTLGRKSLDHLKTVDFFYDFLEKNNLEKKFQSAFWNCYLISYWFARDNSSNEWRHKVKQKVSAFIANHGVPNDKKYQELVNIFNESNSKTFKNNYKRMKSQIAITAILPVFKCEQYLPRCIDSILSQTLENFEIILAVDGGEACYRICDEYAAKDPRIKVIRDKGSYGKSVNAGILAAQGEYISIIECDDWCESDMFEVLYQSAKQYEADVVKGGWFDSFDDERKNKTRLHTYPDGFFNIYEHQDFFCSQPSVWSAIYRKDYLVENDIFFYENRQSFVDAPFHYKTLYCTEGYVLINKPLYHYYQDNPNQSVQSGVKVHDGINAEKFAYDDIKRYPGLWQKIGQGIFAAMLEHLSWNDRRIQEKNWHDEFEKAAALFLSEIDLKDINLKKINTNSYELLRRLLPNIEEQQSDFVEQDVFNHLREQKVDKFILRLFGFIPLFSIEKRGEFTKFKLFSVVNLISLKRNISTIRCYLLKVFPLFVIRKK